MMITYAQYHVLVSPACAWNAPTKAKYVICAHSRELQARAPVCILKTVLTFARALFRPLAYFFEARARACLK